MSNPYQLPQNVETRQFWVSKIYKKQVFHLTVGLHQLGNVSIALPLVYEELAEGTQADAPTMELSKADAVALMDALWDVGIRPSNGEGNGGQIKAMGDHLKDLKDILSQLLKGTS
jgi:hypothetical protein